VNRYLALLLGAVVLGALVSALARAPGPARVGPGAPPTTPTAALDLEVRDGTVAPGTASVPKDHRVMLRIVNRGTRPVRLALAGYEDRLAVVLRPGETWRGEFLADRPGDDFAWLLDGKPAGRLAIAGSHLVDGHR
jgi:hypothetical protein